MRLEIIFKLEIIAIILQLVLILVLFTFNLSDIKQQVKGIKKKTWLILLFILLLGLFFRLMYIPLHRTAFPADEKLQVELAKNIQLSFGANPCYYNEVYSSQHPPLPKCGIGQSYPLVYPFFTSIFSFFFDSFDKSAFFVSFIFGLLAIFLIFFLGYFLLKNEITALFVALFFSFFPPFVEFSNVPNNYTTSIFFTELAVVLVLLAINLKTKKSLLLMGLVLVFTAMTRVENMILLILFMSFVLIKKKVDKKKFWSYFLIALLFYAPFILFLLHPSAHGFAVARNIPFSNLIFNISASALFYNVYFNLEYMAHFSFWLLGLLGFLCLFKNDKANFYFLSSWFFIVFSFHLLFNLTISQFPLSRFTFSYIPLCVISAIGMSCLFQKISHTFHGKVKSILLILMLFLVLLLNINFLIHYPGRTGFAEAYHYLKPDSFYENIQFANASGPLYIEDFTWENPFIIQKEDVSGTSL